MSNSRRPWSPSDSDTLKRLSTLGFDDTQIADRLGFCVKTIRRKRHEMQIPNYFTVRYSNWGSLTADARRAISMVASAA